MNILEKGVANIDCVVDVLLGRVRIIFPAEVCRKHLALFQVVGHVGTLVAGALSLLIGIIAAIKSDSFAMFLIGSAGLVVMIIVDYVSRRFAHVSERLIATTKSYLSSAIYIEGVGLLVLAAGLSLFGSCLYMSIRDGSIRGVVDIGAWSVWLFYLGVLTLNSGELLNVEINKDLKAEEEGVGLLEFIAKSSLLAVSFYFGAGVVLGLVNVIGGIFQGINLGQLFAYAATRSVPGFISIAIIAALPFLACLVFLILYISIATVKSLVCMASTASKSDAH